MAELSFDAALHLAAIVQSSDDAIVSKDLNGVIQSWNQAAERMFGYTAAEAIGRSITIIIPTERLQEEVEVLARIRCGQRIEHFQTVRRRKDGTDVDVSLTVSPVRGSDGRVVGASKTARDVTLQNRLLRELESANRLKDEFLATLSHELRTPLNAILGYARIMQLSPPPDQRTKRAIEIVERNATALARLVADVLDLSRIVSGKVQLDVRACDLPSIIEEAIDVVRPAADARQIALDILLEPAAAPVWGDPARLQQVAWNLLSNAVKFTPAGGWVRVQLERVEGEQVELTVADSGIGIPSEFVPHVFDRFRQADSGYTRAHGGLGLGLALVRHFVELHGGTIWVESEGPGKGSTFGIRLPLMHSFAAALTSSGVESRPHLDLHARAKGARLAGVAVLAIDDEPDSLQLVADALRDAGARVIAVRSAGDALAAWEHRRPDVIVADVGMPGMSGYDFIRALRQREAVDGAQTPAAALTAYARPSDREQALAAGFQVHLSKPIDPSELVEAVGALVGRTAVK
jgi:PAS domain S-box-containing protein